MGRDRRSRPRTTPEVLDALDAALRVLRDEQADAPRAELGVAIGYLQALIEHKRDERD